MVFDFSGNLDLPQLEESVLRYWAEHDVVDRYLAHRPDGRPWVTYEGPPTVNGKPALHHVFTSVYKDVYPRFQTMRGRRVERRGGWDCQGLPVEIAVERNLGLRSKQEIVEHGVEAFTRACQEYATGNIGEFRRTLSRYGYWVDFDRAYRTMDDSYVESVWWHLKEMWDKGLVFEGEKVLPYCFRCGTALSSHELAQPGVYRDREDRSAFVAFPLLDGSAELVAWTTTPWTLPANVAVAVEPDREYGVYAGPDGRKLVLAVSRAAQVVEGEPERVLRGSDLVGRRYTRPYADDIAGAEGVVVGWDGVSDDTGSGLVHLAPAFGEDDAKVCAEAGLPSPNPVDEKGEFTSGPYAGTNVLEAVPRVLADLAERGLLVREHGYTHSYPHCWRCATPLLYWAKPTWYIGTARVKDRFVEENEQVTWHPAHIKHGRFGNWLENNVDWALARDRYWGTPLPVWRCANGHDTCVGSRSELAEHAGRDLAGLSLHRPAVDDIAFPCPDCDRTAHRVQPVCDVWLDSGCMPAAQQGYPATPGSTLRDAYPADFICEAIDQTRGWFYSMLVVNTLTHGSAPYRNVVCLGHLVDDDGRKMSKSLGNVIDPQETLNRFGADGVRWYFFNSGAPWGSRRVSLTSIDQRVGKDLGTLWNVVHFYRRYADLAGFVPGDGAFEPEQVLDRWLVSRLNALVESVTEDLEGYQAHLAAQSIAAFVDDLSNWYIRRGRRRYWSTGETDRGAFATLHLVLARLARLMAPFVPFVAEAIHHAITPAGEGGVRPDSVHFDDWPVAGPRDLGLERDMDTARRATSLLRAARTKAELSVRQPLAQGVVVGLPALPADFQEIVREEVNIRSLAMGDEVTLPVGHLVQPNWRRLGPRYRQLMKELGEAVRTLEADAVGKLRAGSAVTLAVAGQEVTIEPDDVSFQEEVETGWTAVADGGAGAAIDTTLDEGLLAEFRTRRLIRTIQVARRDLGLDIQERVLLWLDDTALASGEEIAREVLAVEVHPLSALPPADGEPYRGEGFALRPASGR
ncbi:isoleucine--tRNA ligase [Kitasatospora sp. NPDC093102]|uniref:isoleucine--tRNA ligase n=1 Tax=Kitasatospora sp. NPDC093102 TaxID=3155069 RepID=UPI00342FF022